MEGRYRHYQSCRMIISLHRLQRKFPVQQYCISRMLGVFCVPSVRSPVNATEEWCTLLFSYFVSVRAWWGFLVLYQVLYSNTNRVLASFNDGLYRARMSASILHAAVPLLVPVLYH